VAGEPAGDVEQPVAEAFRFAAGELAAEEQPLRPGEQVLAAETYLPGAGRAWGSRLVFARLRLVLINYSLEPGQTGV
jgi:hypothetical protein